jgi:SAM-dependent methyltransferase
VNKQERTLNPAGHYADDRSFRARQRLWQQQAPMFDTVSWVLSLTEFSPGTRVLDAGCGNGLYLRALAGRAVRVVGCDLSMGMLRAVGHPVLVNADVTALPIRGGVFDVVLATHMLYHVPDREAAVRELRRVLASGGTCVAVTNGARHMLSLRALVEQAVRTATPGWQMRAATHAFEAENAADQLSVAFDSVTCVRPAVNVPAVVRDATIAADFVASWADFYARETVRPWTDVVADVRREVQAVIDRDGSFAVSGDLAAFICRLPADRDELRLEAADIRQDPLPQRADRVSASCLLTGRKSYHGAFLVQLRDARCVLGVGPLDEQSGQVLRLEC